VAGECARPRLHCTLLSSVAALAQISCEANAATLIGPISDEYAQDATFLTLPNDEMETDDPAYDGRSDRIFDHSYEQLALDAEDNLKIVFDGTLDENTIWNAERIFSMKMDHGVTVRPPL